MPLTRRQLLATTLAAPLGTAFATRARAATHQVTIQNFAFSPANLTVAVGDTVTFVNADGAPHTATSGQPGLFDTGTLQQGQSASVTIGFSGTADYTCRFHGSMRGSITAS